MGGPLNRSALLIPGQRQVSATEMGALALQRLSETTRIGLIAERSLSVARMALDVCFAQNIALIHPGTGDMLDGVPNVLDAAIALASAVVEAADQATAARIFPQAPTEEEEETEEKEEEEEEAVN